MIFCTMGRFTGEAALEGFSRQLKKLPEPMRISFTYDRDRELRC